MQHTGTTSLPGPAQVSAENTTWQQTRARTRKWRIVDRNGYLGVVPFSEEPGIGNSKRAARRRYEQGLWLAALLVLFLAALGSAAMGSSATEDPAPSTPEQATTQAESKATVTLRVIDQTGAPIACRLYIESADGRLLTLEENLGAPPTASVYQVDRGSSREIHTAISADRFQFQLDPGNYRISAWRGKEFVPAEEIIDLKGGEELTVELQLKRWISMADRGWFSGDTHVHLPLDRCRLAQVSEDLNVAIPITYWVTDTRETPVINNRAQAPQTPELIVLDERTMIWPVNTEYEIFSVAGERHTLGAFFAINHRHPLQSSVPPIGRAIAEARAQGALIDLDKHNWPWSMMLPPVAGVDLYELSNNHVWQTEFLFGNWYPEYIAPWMKIELDTQGQYDERGWLEFGFRNYYALLNCGLRISPTAGTATGVHPVPIGFGRVYVQLDGALDYDQWIDGLRAGRSFVTTGPMLEIQVDGELPGSTISASANQSLTMTGWIESPERIGLVELIADGDVIDAWTPAQSQQANGVWRVEVDESVEKELSGWIALRCWEERVDGRPRFAHTAPFYVSIEGMPLRAWRDETEYLLERVEQELARSREKLDPESITEFEQAAEFYRRVLETARD